MLKTAALLVLCAFKLQSADASEPFTKTTSFMCRLTCPETWFHEYDTWMTYVDCQTDCKVVVQPWLSWLIQVDCDMHQCKDVKFQPWEQIAGILLIVLLIIVFVVSIVIGICNCLASCCKAAVDKLRQ